jgi:hypothetical protein
LNKVLDKLYKISNSSTREKLNSNIEHYTYSDKDNEIIKLIGKMFCITDFDSQPFRSIVELSLAKKHKQIKAIKAAQDEKIKPKVLGGKKTTRKSSSRVSQKTRRHRRTSR